MVNVDLSDSNRYPQRAAVIIDGGYWEALKKALAIKDIDLLQLTNDLCKPAYRFRTFYFDGRDRARQSLHDKLDVLTRFEVVLGDVVKREMECPHCHRSFPVYEQKRVDVLISVKLVHLATTQQVDMIVFIAGDRDFLPVIETAKRAGVVIRLAYGTFGDVKVSSGLFKESDERINLTKDYLADFIKSKAIQPLATHSTSKARRKAKQKTVHYDKKEKQQLIDKVIDIIAELMKEKGKEEILASELGLKLAENEINYPGKLKDFVKEYSQDKIQLKQKGKTLLFSLSDKVQQDKGLNKIKDPGVATLTSIIKEVQKENQTNYATLNDIAHKLHNKVPTWKQKFNVPKTSPLVNLLERANPYIYVRGDGPDRKVFLK